MELPEVTKSLLEDEEDEEDDDEEDEERQRDKRFRHVKDLE